MTAITYSNLDVIFNCTYELHQFTSLPILLKTLRELKMEYKDVLFFTIIREMSTKEFAGSDRPEHSQETDASAEPDSGRTVRRTEGQKESVLPGKTISREI